MKAFIGIFSIVSILSFTSPLSDGAFAATTKTTTPVPVKALVTSKVTSVLKPAVSTMKVAAWLPYWKVDDAVNETLLHMDKLDEISPFAFTVKADGTLKNNFTASTTDTADDSVTWKLLADTVHQNKKLDIPTILWTDKAQMERILNNSKQRAIHIKSIVSEVKLGKYDGIDIDYEGKTAETRVGYSKFLTELQVQLKKNNKKLVCTIEARTPVDSRYRVVTETILKNIEYANDYKVIGKVCGEVRIMTYDQIGGDVKLADENSQSLYRPVSDIDWVEKVLTLGMRDIPAKKIFAGVATYGYKYEILPPKGTSTIPTYSRIGSMNFTYADALAKQLKITPLRKGGEAYYTYSTTTDIYGVPLGVSKEYLVWYSDAEAIADKVRLAKLYKIGGIALFKIDGANDPMLWNYIK
jgi:spore germination protein YaaH